MECKTFEILDSATFIPALAVKLKPDCEADRYLLGRAGYGRFAELQAEYVVLWRLEGGPASYDVYDWGGSRTMSNAHKHIIENFDALESGSVIDVAFILGETSAPKVSESVNEFA